MLVEVFLTFASVVDEMTPLAETTLFPFRLSLIFPADSPAFGIVKRFDALLFTAFKLAAVDVLAFAVKEPLIWASFYVGVLGLGHCWT